MCKIWARKYSGLRFETLSCCVPFVSGAEVERVLYLHVTGSFKAFVTYYLW